MRIDKGLALQIEVAEQPVFFVKFQLDILREDTLSFDFFSQIGEMPLLFCPGKVPVAREVGVPLFGGHG